MTTLGKILVIVNLIFSLFTGAMVVGVFATRTNWRANFEKTSQLLQVAQANSRTFEERMIAADQARAVASQNADKLAQQVQAVETKLQGQMALLKQNHDEHARNAAQADQNAKKAQAEAQARADEVVKHYQFIKERDALLFKVQAEAKDQRDRAVQGEITTKHLLERNANLQQALEAMSKEVERLRSGNTGGQYTNNPPLDDVEGSVKSTDASGLITLSIGSDAGLRQSNTLEIYRFKPEPKYLGRIQIVNLNAHEAVARPLNPLRVSAIQAGDRVGTFRTQTGR